MMPMNNEQVTYHGVCNEILVFQYFLQDMDDDR
jgi:hypothetical protein